MAQKNASKKDMPEWAKMELENAKQDEYTKKAQDAYHKIMPNPEMKKKGGKIKEGKETYASKAAMMKHEKAESPAKERAEMRGYKAGGSVKGWGMARGARKARSC